jgi:hypothetical protein
VRYKHSDGYPDGAVCWITKALEHAWPLPRFAADEFAAAFVAANKPSAKTRRMDYVAKAEWETDPERKLHLLKTPEDYGPGGRYADCVGGVCPVSKPGPRYRKEPAARRSTSGRGAALAGEREVAPGGAFDECLVAYTTNSSRVNCVMGSQPVSVTTTVSLILIINLFGTKTPGTR